MFFQLTTEQKFQRMKAQKVPENDPEYLKAHRFLTAVQQQQNFRKLALAQQQKQQQQLQQGQQTNGNTNGVIRSGPQSDGTAPTTNGVSHTATNQNTGNANTQQNPA